MKPIIKYIFVIILFLSIYHLIRDILQTFGINNIFTNIFHRSHLWCNPFCNFVTYPLDLIDIFGSLIVLKRNRVGKIGIFVILFLPFWIIVGLLP